MEVKIQLICMFVSFIYGIFICLFLLINKYLFNKNNKIIRILIDLLNVYVIVVLYTIIIYQLNKGIFHLYFLLLMLFGFLFMKKYVNFTIDVLKRVKKKIIK